MSQAARLRRRAAETIVAEGSMPATCPWPGHADELCDADARTEADGQHRCAGCGGELVDRGHLHVAVQAGHHSPASFPGTPSKPAGRGVHAPTQSLEVDFKSMPDLLDIGEVAHRSGMAASALRFYEREEIIASVDRKGLRRQFAPDVLTTLAVVAMCRQAGFWLEEIKELLATEGRPEWKSFAAHKRDELRAQAEHLGALAEQLDHALECPSRNVFECEHFRAALDGALPVASCATFGASGAKPR